MTIFSDQASAAATTRDVYVTQRTNLILNGLDTALGAYVTDRAAGVPLDTDPADLIGYAATALAELGVR